MEERISVLFSIDEHTPCVPPQSFSIRCCVLCIINPICGWYKPKSTQKQQQQKTESYCLINYTRHIVETYLENLFSLVFPFLFGISFCCIVRFRVFFFLWFLVFLLLVSCCCRLLGIQRYFRIFCVFFFINLVWLYLSDIRDAWAK